MDGEDDGLVIAPEGLPQRWALGRPVDPYGDGHVHRVFVEVSDEGITASGWTTFESKGPQTLRDFLSWLGQDWRGWTGTAAGRPWRTR